MIKPIVRVFLVSPWATMPEICHDDEDIGYDVATRAIVSAEMDPKNPHARKVLWDFRGQPDASLQHKLGHARVKGKLVNAFMLNHMESILLGTGIALGMERDLYAELRPRSSTANGEFMLMNGSVPDFNSIAMFHNHVPWDPGFKGEGVMRVMNFSRQPFPVSFGWKPSQLVFLREGRRNFERPILKQVFSPC